MLHSFAPCYTWGYISLLQRIISRITCRLHFELVEHLDKNFVLYVYLKTVTTRIELR
jgi:hypothetical protein